MKIVFIMILSFALLFFVSCDKSNSVNSSTTGFQTLSSPFLKNSDFTVSNEMTLEQSDVALEIESWSSLWNYKTSDDSSSSIDLNSCLTNLKVRLKSSDTIIIGGADDVTTCMAKSNNSPDVTIVFNKYTYKFYTEIQCVGVNLSQFEGQSLSNTLNEQIETSCGTANHYLLNNINVDMDMTITVSGTTTRSVFTTKSAHMTSSNTVCSENFDGTNWIIANGCIDQSKTQIGQNSTNLGGKEDLVKLTPVDLVRSAISTTPFFISGSQTLYLKGWQGSVTYSGGSSNATWTMTKDGQTETGTLTPSILLLSSEKKHWLDLGLNKLNLNYKK